MIRVRKSNNNSKKYIICSIIIFLITFLYSCFSNSKLYWDSLKYWNYSDKFLDNFGHFSVFNYNDNIRGYLFPFIIYVIKKLSSLFNISNALILLWIFNGLIFAVLFGIYIPKIFSKLFNRDIGFVSILLYFSIIIIFWRGYFGFPLSDFPSLLCAVISYYSVLKISKDNKSIKNYIFVFISAISLGASINIRPSYNIIIPVICIYLICKLKREKNIKNWKYAIIYTSIFILGFVVILFPQIVINKKNNNVISPFVITKTDNGTDLFSTQLVWGIQNQKYETYVGNQENIDATLFFRDNRGEKIIQQENITKLDIVSYIKLVLKYPFSFGGIYFRHIFNALDIKYPKLYIDDIYSVNVLFSLLNYTIIYIFIVTFCKMIKIKEYKNFDFIFLTLMILFSVAISIPTAIEVRFMLPLQVFIYAVILYSGINNKFFNDICNFIKDKKYIYAIKYFIFKYKPVLYVLFVIICYTLSIATYKSFYKFPIFL